MNHNNVVFVLLVVGWLCSIGECRVLQSRTIGGYKKFQLKDSVSELDCNQFSNDYDIIRQLPFPILINPSNNSFDHSTVTTDKNNTFVEEIYIYQEEVVPLSVFCLSNLQRLAVLDTPFQDGIVPDALGNLKQLQDISIYSSPIVKLTEQLGTLSNITQLLLSNCSLYHIQNLNKLEKMWYLELSDNHLSHLDGIPGVEFLKIDGNLFKEIPTTNNKDKLRFLDMNNNPLTNAVSILSYKNLEIIYLENATLTSIPPAIDKLQKIKALYLTDNKISYLPTNVLNLPNLEEFGIRNNLLSSNDIKSIKKAFGKSHPNLEMFI